MAPVKNDVAKEKKNTPKPKAAAKKKGAEVNEDKIRARAFELYEKSGGQPGQDVEHWLQAEKEIKKKK